jgi:hypothetical protein
MSLASRWLDLDRIAGASEDAGPLESVIPLAIGLRDLLPADSRSRATFSVDQANVGREAVSGLRLSLARSKDKLEIEELRLGLPGGSRGELQGVVSGPPEAPVFDGSINLRRTSLVRFLGWATAGALRSIPKATARSALLAVDDRAGRAAAQYHRRSAGDRDFRERAIPLGGAAEVSLSLEGPQLDARALVPAGASLADVSMWCCTARLGPRWGQVVASAARGLGAPSPAGAARKPTPPSGQSRAVTTAAAPTAMSPWRSSLLAVTSGFRSCASRAMTASASSSKAMWTTPPRAQRASPPWPAPTRAPRSLLWRSCLAFPEAFVPTPGGRAMVPLRLAGSLALVLARPPPPTCAQRRG